MASAFYFKLVVIFALMTACDLRRRIKELSEIEEIQIPFVCGSVDQCYGCEQCDDMCRFYNNSCCGENSTTPVPSLEEWQYDCVRTFPDMQKMELDCWSNSINVQGVFMITKCSKDWTDAEEKFNCEEENETLLSRIHVYENNSEHITYKNLHCAVCNNVIMQNVVFWEFEVECNFSDSLDVVSNFDKNICVTYFFPSSNYRTCAKDMITTCSDFYSNFSIYNIKDRCEKGQTGPLYADIEADYKAYKNPDCYLCNEFNLTEFDVRLMFSGVGFGVLYCKRPNTCHVPIPSYSLKRLVNLNIRNEHDTIVLLGKPGEGNVLRRNTTSCNATDKLCPYETCEFVEVIRTKIALNETTLFLRPLNAYFPSNMFYSNGTEVFVCLNTSQREYLKQKQSQNILQSIFTFVGLLVSVVCLLVTFCLYLCLRQLRNDHGNIMMNLMVSLFCAQLSFLVSFSFQNIKVACVTFGILTHYFFLAAFCSMNVVGFDIFKTFSDLLVQGSRRTRVLVSIFYSWAFPVVIVLPAVILDHAHLPVSMFPYRPEYGNGSCWINSSTALLSFFIIPLAVFKLIDIVLFAITAFVIAKSVREGSGLKKTQNRCSFVINLKLAVIMGLTWLFSFLATSLDNSFLSYLFIICNSLQGLFIFLSLTCTRNVFNIISRKRRNLSTDSSNKLKSTSASLKNMSN